MNQLYVVQANMDGVTQIGGQARGAYADAIDSSQDVWPNSITLQVDLSAVKDKFTLLRAIDALEEYIEADLWPPVSQPDPPGSKQLIERDVFQQRIFFRGGQARILVGDILKLGQPLSSPVLVKIGLNPTQDARTSGFLNLPGLGDDDLVTQNSLFDASLPRSLIYFTEYRSPGARPVNVGVTDGAA